jgi:DNA-binding NarL/FixJ family response regulator
VRSGQSSLDQELAARLLRQLATEGKDREGIFRTPEGWRGEGQCIQPLTPRELEILELLKEGYTNRQIARELFITPGTVKNHVEHIIAKLGVSDRTQAVVRALEQGIIGFPRR